MSCPLWKRCVLTHIGNAPVETLHHAVGLGCSGRGQAVLNAQGLAELIKLVLARRLMLSLAPRANMTCVTSPW